MVRRIGLKPVETADHERVALLLVQYPCRQSNRRRNTVDWDLVLDGKLAEVSADQQRNSIIQIRWR